jgi:hypothetical protein
MTYDEFVSSLSEAVPLAALPPLLRALWLEYHGDWPAAHEIAQDDETDPVACWLHAYLHRREGDLANANYWYRRAGRVRFAGSEAEEWSALVRAALLDSAQRE